MTGSGRAILELFERESIKPIVVNVTGSSEAETEVEHRFWRVPKTELVGVLRVAYESESPEFGRQLDDVGVRYPVEVRA